MSGFVSHDDIKRRQEDAELADRYRQARVLCGGEDPVEWIGRAQRGLYALQEQLKHANSARQQWRDEAAAMEIKTKGLANELGSRLRECEEALRSADAEHEKFRAAVTEPLNSREGRSVESLSWDELLGVANRNLTEALDLGRDRDSLLDLVQRLIGGPYALSEFDVILEEARAALAEWEGSK